MYTVFFYVSNIKQNKWKIYLVLSKTWRLLYFFMVNIFFLTFDISKFHILKLQSVCQFKIEVSTYLSNFGGAWDNIYLSRDHKRDKQKSPTAFLNHIVYSGDITSILCWSLNTVAISPYIYQYAHMFHTTDGEYKKRLYFAFTNFQ